MLSLATLTDRERLAFAFDDLRQFGYYAPVEFAWEVCCRSCGERRIAKEAPQAKGYVFWHQQYDDRAFMGEDWGLLPECVFDMMAGVGVDMDRVDAIDDWLAEHRNYTDAAMLDNRLTNYNMLLEPLHLHWDGEELLIVNALRARGLAAVAPLAPHSTIEVVPQ